METQKPKNKSQTVTATTAAKTPAPAPTPAPLPGRVPPLFRKIDWLALAIAFGVVWIVYFLTLAPELTLEDSGELCTGAYYAGIPHPPGYPFWTIYAWFWTAILPMGNVAWRVEVGEATAAAMACGLVGLMVSRGSSMLMESIEELKGITGKWENVICVVSGIVAGIMLGLGGVMWSESVAINRISLFGVPWVMTVMVFLFRWIYAPHQRRYLFCAFFFFGLCATIHQTLLVAAMGLEAAIAASQPRLGRNLFLGNSLAFLGGLVGKATHIIHALDVVPGQNLMLPAIFYAVGIGSIAAYVWFAIRTKETFEEFCQDGAAAAFVLLLVATPTFGPICGVLAVVALGTFFALAARTWELGHEWLVVFVCFVLWVLGVMFYLYEPIAGMTNPPMQWGYPRTVEGFWHAIFRGQYEQPNPTDLFTWDGWQLFFTQLGMLLSDIAMEFNWVILFLALIPLLFFRKLRQRERSWIIGLGGVYLCIGILLVILMHPMPDRQSAELHKVFFISSHGVIAIMAGYGLALTAAYMATHYQKFRVVGLWLGILTLLPALIALYNGVNNTFYGDTGSLPPREVLYLFCCLAAAFVLTALAAQWFIRSTAAASGSSGDERLFALAYGVAALICLCMSVEFAFFNEKCLKLSQVLTALNHLFSPNQYNFPILAGLLILGTSLAFIGSLLVYRQRAPLAVTLGLFAIMPLASGLAHWGSSEQRDHWFGYWFGHDMFTPPFAGPDGKLSYDADLRNAAMKGTNAALVYPEMPRNAILFGGTDPGRFCPTYMIFCESFIPHAQQPQQDQKFDRRDVYIITQNALADGTYMDYIRAHYNRSKQIDPPFFQELLRGTNEIQQNYTTNFLARLAYQFLDKPLTELGAKIEARRRKEGVYPREEIYIPTPHDSEVCYSEFMQDVQQRMEHDRRFPNEPKQMRGEAITPRADGTYGVSGQVSVMAINGLLCKVIFDHCPSNEFFVEESFPLDWMYPYLSPFGVIMKVNRQPVEEMSEEAVRRDHEFWSRYSERLIGNWMTYDTTVKEITDFVEKVYLQHDFTGFKGNRRFVRDEQAQKSFSKLRSAIGGSIYEWRFQHPKSVVEQQRMLKEANFALAQAFAFCPSSPEAVYHYVVLLVNLGRVDDALQVARTWQKLDPYNDQANSMVTQLSNMKNGPAAPAPTPSPAPVHATMDQMEKTFHDRPTDYQNALSLVAAYMQAQQTDKATGILDQMLNSPITNQEALQFVAEAYGQLGNFPKLEATVEKLTQLDPHSPEWWYNLAAVKLMLGKTPEALSGLRTSLDENAKRLATNPQALNLLVQARKDPRFTALRSNAEFLQLTK